MDHASAAKHVEEVSPLFRLTACELAFAAGYLVCGTMGFSPAPGAVHFLDLLCSADAQLDPPIPVVGNQITLNPFVQFPPGVFIEAQTVPICGPFPGFSARGGRRPRSFVINPADPAPFKDYAATVVATCVDTMPLAPVS